MKRIKYIFLAIWTLWCLFGISQNYLHYKFLDWTISFFLLFIPYLILWYRVHRKINKPKKSLQNHSISKNDALPENIPPPFEQYNSHFILDIDDDKMGPNTDKKEITEEEVPHLIQCGLKEVIRQNAVVQTYPMYMNMRIVSNTIPVQENYAILNNNEKLFFQAFYKQLINAKLSPSLVKFTRMSNGGFNVDYINLCYVGKINLYQPPIKYAVIKKGNKRATKIFDTPQEVESFISQNSDYEIMVRQPKTTNSMQYLRGSAIKNLSNLSIEQCIEYIPYWIRYIRYCKRN